MSTSRVCCLYRVSTTRQVDVVAKGTDTVQDISMQRIACHELAQAKGWTITAEYQEAGISGFHNPTFEREAIRQIIDSAERKEFDILLVYAVDRISRRDYELPMLFGAMHDCGIMIWSVKEGELPYNDSDDRLKIYLFGWKASGESERLGQRIQTKQSQMVARGEYRGGTVPFGYMLEDTGETTKSGRIRHVLKICENEATVIRMIFDMIANQGYSAYEVSRWIQTAKLPDGIRCLAWRSASIHVMLRNSIYIGCMHFNDEVSMPFADLQIVDPAVFKRANEKLSSRRSVPTEKSKRKLTEPEPPPLYRDRIYCGHCGSRLVHNHGCYQKQDGSFAFYYNYRCYNKERFNDVCESLSTYSAARIDSDVIKHTQDLARMLLYSSEQELIDNAVSQARADFLSRRETTERELAEKEKQLRQLEKGIAEALSLYGPAAATHLEIVYTEVKNQRDILRAQFQKLRPSSFAPERLSVLKGKELSVWKQRCRSLNGKMSLERLSAVFFTKISVYKAFRIVYSVAPEVSQFFSGALDFDSLTISEPARNQAADTIL
ncbi:MAG: recombinase family protein [Clostridia bacterium]|nr:recombinase family protein [Clostridia bacterium]